MKTRWILAVALCATSLLPAASGAQETPGTLGLGAILGVPFGAAAKYLITRDQAIDFALGASEGDLDVHADLMIHLRQVLPQPKAGKLPLFLGLGIKIKDGKDTFVGIRFQGGIAYLVPRAPVELFAEIVPVLRLAPNVDNDFDGAVGVRYYFGAKR